ncbi:hypothetical protein ACLB2K_004130 [Fragaria x ananassa]
MLIFQLFVLYAKSREEETALHLFRDCQMAVQLTHHLTNMVSHSSSLSLKEWLCCCSEKMSNDNLCRLLVKCWLLWKARNDKYLQANVAPPLAPRPRYRWKKLNCGWFSVCMDGALEVTSQVGGVGIIVRDECGQFICGKAMSFDQVSSPAHIEAVAGKVACNLVLEHGFSPALLVQPLGNG